MPVKKTQSGTVDKRTKEGKAIAERMAKARAAIGTAKAPKKTASKPDAKTTSKTSAKPAAKTASKTNANQEYHSIGIEFSFDNSFKTCRVGRVICYGK